MAVYRNVQLSFWTDNKVEDDFTPEDKYFYLYLLTNPQTNICGCYEVSYKQMCYQTGYNKDTILRLLKRFENEHHVISYSDDTKEVLVFNWSKYNWTKSPKVTSAVENVAKYIKNPDFKQFVEKRLDDVKNGREIDYTDRVSIPYQYPRDTSVSDTVSDTDTVSDNTNYSEIVINIINYLNDRCNTHYKSTSKDTVKHIKARLNDGFTEDDFYTVIDKKADEWIGTEQEKFLRPMTLFGTKFEGYLNQNIVNNGKHVNRIPSFEERLMNS